MRDNSFRNLTVLSMEQALTLPFLTYRLVHDGVRVIRLEHPHNGDPNRYVGDNVLDEAGMNTYYLPYNAGKEAITLNLATEEGRHILHSLLRRLPVDIFVCNTRAKNYRKLGIDYETLHDIKPDLIWLGITGFGPDRDEAAYDPILQARAGFMNLTGEPDGEPQIFGLPMVDLGAAEHAYGEIMKALYRRATTDAGSRIDVSMYRSAVSWTMIPFTMVSSFGQTLKREGNTHRFFAPASVYSTDDGHIFLAVGSDTQWERVTQLPGFGGLAREEYRRNAGRIAAKDRLNHEIAEITREWPTDELVTRLSDLGVPASSVLTVADVTEDTHLAPHVIHAQDPVTGLTITMPPPPVTPQFMREQDMYLSFPPRQGEHNETVYGQTLGYSEEEIAALQERGVV